jgi:hypothetical protein
LPYPPGGGKFKLGPNDPTSILGENKIRQIVIITAAAWFAVIVALFGATAKIAGVPQQAAAAATSGPIDIMQMMGASKALPVEQYDAN